MMKSCSCTKRDWRGDDYESDCAVADALRRLSKGLRTALCQGRVPDYLKRRIERVILNIMRELETLVNPPSNDDSSEIGAVLNALERLRKSANEGLCVSSKALSAITHAAEEVINQHEACNARNRDDNYHEPYSAEKSTKFPIRGGGGSGYA